MKILIVLIVLLLFACNQTIEQVNEKSISEADTTASIIENDSTKQGKIEAQNQEFLNFYYKFTDAIKTKSSIAPFAHNDYGLYIIKSNGALPQIEHLYSNEQFYYLPELKIIQTQDLDLLTLVPLFENLPKLVCEENPYDKSGCFAEEKNPFMENRIWNYAGLNEKEIQAIEMLSETVKYTVVNTHNFTFQFSFIEEKWHITFIDMRTPCSA